MTRRRPAARDLPPVHGEGHVPNRAAAISTSTSPPARSPDADEPVIVGPISMLGDLDPGGRGHRAWARACAASRSSRWRRSATAATSTGAFHEGMNFAAVQKLPLVVVAEDNKYAYSTPIAKQMAIDADRRARRRRTASRTRWSTATTCSRSTTSRKRMVDARARRRRRDAHRRRHDAHAGPRAARRRALRAEGAARRVGGEGSARPVSAGADRRAAAATEKPSSPTSTG